MHSRRVAFALGTVGSSVVSGEESFAVEWTDSDEVRFVVRATRSEEFAVSDESHALAWRDIVAIADDTAADPSLRRMARKWLARGVG